MSVAAADRGERPPVGRLAGATAALAFVAVTTLALRGQPLWVFLACYLAPIAAWAALPRLQARRRRAFERDLARHVREGRQGELVAFYERQRLLLLLAPHWYLAAARARIYAELGDHAAAARSYEDALASAPADEHPELRMALAHALYAMGEYGRAEPLYRELVVAFEVPPRVHEQLGRLLLRTGGNTLEALFSLERAAAGLEGEAAVRTRCDLAEALARAGRFGDARAQLEQAFEDLPSNDVGFQARYDVARAEVERAEQDAARRGRATAPPPDAFELVPLRREASAAPPSAPDAPARAPRAITKTEEMPVVDTGRSYTPTEPHPLVPVDRAKGKDP